MADIQKAREWHLVRRPDGRASVDDFALVEAHVPEIGPGQILVRNTHLSVDPYMRGRMDDRPSYVPPFALDAPLDGAAMGVVEESRADGIEPGQAVQHFHGLREAAVVDVSGVAPIDLDGLPPEVYLGALGAPGLTAWLGVTQVAAVQPGDTVLVTGAAGAVGSLAGQIARLRGAARVIGTAGSADKKRHLREDLGFDAAIDHREADVDRQLADAAPDGVDIVFDNVGGRLLESAINHLRVGARLALCGAVSQYDGHDAYGVRNLYALVTKRATARGFLVTDHMDRLPEFHAEVAPWIREGRIVHRETVLDGIEQVPGVLLDQLRSGTHIVGKAVVRIGDPA